MLNFGEDRTFSYKILFFSMFIANRTQLKSRFTYLVFELSLSYVVCWLILWKLSSEFQEAFDFLDCLVICFSLMANASSSDIL